MKINWKLRFKNPAFWIFILTIVFTNFATGLNIELHDLTTWTAVWNLIYRSLLTPSVLIPTLLSVYLGAVDYTTKGIGDCDTMLKLKNPQDKK